MSENVINTETQKEPGKGSKVVKSILNTLINILIVIVLIVSILIAVMAISSRASGVSTIFGNTIQTIQSDSMLGGSPDGYPEGNFGQGDLMIAKPIDRFYNGKFALGDIVTFVKTDSTGEDMLIVHRIVDVADDGNGNLTYQTQGDNRETSPVPDQQDKKDYLKAWDIVSVYYTNGYTGKILKGWGAALDFLRTQQGFFFVILLPMILFFVYELIRVILNYNRYRKAQAEEEKQAAVDAALAEKDNVQDPENLTPEQMEQFKKFLEQQKQSTDDPGENSQ